MAIVHDDFANLAQGSVVHKVVGGVIAGVPGCLVVDQNVNLRGMRGLFDGKRIVQADRERLFHHDVNAVAGGDLDDSAVVVRIGVCEHRLRVGFGNHFLKVGEQGGLIEAIAGCRLGKQLAVGFCYADDLDLRAVPRLIEESVHVSVNQANDADSQWRPCGRGLRVAKNGGEQDGENGERG